MKASSLIPIGILAASSLITGCRGAAQTPLPPVQALSGWDMSSGADIPEATAVDDSAATPQSGSLAPGAGSTFDPAGLSIGPGSRFIVLDDPRVIPAAEATWLSPDEIVLGVEVGAEARAYPISQMAYHHIVNDEIGGVPYLVTY